MIYVHQSVGIRFMEVISDEFAEVHRDQIKSVSRKGFMPREIKMKDGDVYLFMTVRYYTKEFTKGRRDGVDHIVVNDTGKIYQGPANSVPVNIEQYEGGE